VVRELALYETVDAMERTTWEQFATETLVGEIAQR
jgi:hypothetical protein